MFPIPQIQIRQTYALLAFKAEPATLDIQQPQATIEMHTKQAKMHIEQAKGQLKIDPSKAWDALGSGGPLEMNRRIASQMAGLANDAIAKIVTDGNRMANLISESDSIPHIAWDNATTPLPHIQYTEDPSVLNVSMEYEYTPAKIEAEMGDVEYKATPNRPVIESRRGAFDAYLAQRNSVEIIAPQLDMRL